MAAICALLQPASARRVTAVWRRYMNQGPPSPPGSHEGSAAPNEDRHCVEMAALVKELLHLGVVRVQPFADILRFDTDGADARVQPEEIEPLFAAGNPI